MPAPTDLTVGQLSLLEFSLQLTREILHHLHSETSDDNSLSSLYPPLIYVPQNVKSHIAKGQTQCDILPPEPFIHLPHTLNPAPRHGSSEKQTPRPDPTSRRSVEGHTCEEKQDGFFGELESLCIPCLVEVNRIYACEKLSAVNQKRSELNCM